MTDICPCCEKRSWKALAETNGRCCLTCGHVLNDSAGTAIKYPDLMGRNDLDNRKFEERSKFIANILNENEKVLEIGCAEGYLGKLVKELIPVAYDGVEISLDAVAAKEVVNNVFSSTENLKKKSYDMIIAFHVLEHLHNIRQELEEWKSLLKPDGKIIIEVPNRSGHPLLPYDTNPEHYHQFSPSSLTCLMGQLGLDVTSLETNKFESVAYPDSIRLTVTIRKNDLEKKQSLIRILNQNTGPFLIWGIGGDFLKFVLPIITNLPTAGLIDSDKNRHGKNFGNFEVRAFDPKEDLDKKYIITTLKFGAEIQKQMSSFGIPKSNILTLSELLDPRNTDG